MGAVRREETKQAFGPGVDLGKLRDEPERRLPGTGPGGCGVP